MTSIGLGKVLNSKSPRKENKTTGTSRKPSSDTVTTDPNIFESSLFKKGNRSLAQKIYAQKIQPSAVPSATESERSAVTNTETDTPKKLSSEKRKRNNARKVSPIIAPPKPEPDIAKAKKVSEAKEARSHLPLYVHPAEVILPVSINTPAFKSLGLHKQELGHVLHTNVIVKDVTSSSSSSSESGFLHVVEALRVLSNHEYIFMQRLSDFLDIEAKGVTFREVNPVDLAFQLMDKEGDVLFVLEQHKILCSSFIIFSRAPFITTLYDLHGNKVMKFIGPMVYMSRLISKMKITDGHGNQLGYIKTFGSTVNYSVYNAKGERIFLVSSNRFLPSSKTIFTILYKGRRIGEIKNGWSRTHSDKKFLDSFDAGIEFPAHLDEREKTLLIGCMMLIEFFWLSPFTRLKLFFMLLILFLTIFALALSTIPIIVDDEPDDPSTVVFFHKETMDAVETMGS